MSDARDAEFLQVIPGQLRQDFGVDRIVAERGVILFETEVLEPRRDVHGRLHSARWDDRLRMVICKASTNCGCWAERRANGHQWRSQPVSRKPLSCASHPRQSEGTDLSFDHPLFSQRLERTPAGHAPRQNED